ncbi:MAG TPA: Ig-like domain-containing protein [Bacteroidota bacterium]|jgi:hypothetical protein|nr:Ig-like domain-containing protein [Bacteroidota bacterium]
MLDFLILSCAGQLSPSGGPPDTTPPEVAESSPAPNSLNFGSRKISIKFSEYVDRSSVEQSIFLSPPVGGMSFDWGGTDVEITFSDTLRPNTTYILTLGTDIVDRRNHNRMAQAFALPFSTGSKIDSARISGRVFASQPTGIMIFAFKLNDRISDTLNPVHSRPDYITQTGKDGSYKLTNIAYGSYRLIAVRDEYKNLLYDKQTDEFGINTRDVQVAADTPAAAGMYCRMSKEDTTRPFLSSARGLDRSHIVLRFSEPFDTSQVNARSISVVDTLKRSALPVLDVSPIEGFAADAQISTALQESSRTYLVTASGIRDLQGNLISSQAQTSLFTSAQALDTTKPDLQLLGIQDSAKNVQADDSIRFSFGEGVQRSLFEHGCTLLTTDGVQVQGKFIWRGSTSVFFIPLDPLRWAKWYTLRVVMDSVRDFAGNGYRDSIWVRHFRMIEDKVLGSISGVVRNESETSGATHITVSEILSKNSRSRTVIAGPGGNFSFNFLPEGRYTLFAFCDSDSNGVYSYGKPYPFMFAEPFSILPDTLKVRARWPLDGVVIRIP